MNFSLKTAFTMSHRFWTIVCLFSFVSRNFLISSLISFLTHSFFNILLFNLLECLCFWGFSLRLVFSFRPLWSEKMLHMISIFLNLLRLLFVSYHMVNLKMFHVHFASLGWQVLHMCFKSISSSASFSATISLLILCSEDRSIVDSGLFQTP